MKNLKLFEAFGTYSDRYVINHIKSITPDDSDIPDYFINNFIKGRKFTIEEVNINDLMNTDASFKEYIDSGEERYDQDDKSPHSLENELVVVDGEVMDGYSRSSQLLKQGQETTMAYVAKPK